MGELSRRILIVEDNPTSREILRALLEVWGYGVDEAADGPEAVQMALACRPQAVVLDIGLLGLDGYEVARLIRQALGGNTLLIALTAYGSTESRQRASQAGIAHFLTKPADPQELRRLLQALSPAA